MTGTVRRVRGGVYDVLLDDGGRVKAVLRGRLKREVRTGDRVVVGDRVEVREAEGGGAAIESVEARATELVRRGHGGRRPKVIAANVDRLVPVVSAEEPRTPPAQVDRLLAIGESNRLECALVVNKIDLAEPAEVERRFGLYGDIGYPVLRVSAKTGEGLGEVERLLCEGTSALIGPSGVGKSTILNAIQPGLRLRTRAVGRRSRRGRHATVNSVLVSLECGGRVADTPGFADVGLWGINPAELDACFPEFLEHVGRCRFAGSCTHTHEPGCGVREAVETGAIAASRYESYRRLLQEA